MWYGSGIPSRNAGAPATSAAAANESYPMAKDKEHAQDLIHKAQAAVNQRHYQDARAMFLRALELRPDSPEAHYGLATVCFHQGDLLGAAHHFKEVTRHDPLRAGAFVNLGALYNHLGREDDAVTTLRRGIQLDPHRAEGYYNLGLVYRKMGRLEQAAEAYREAVRIQPTLAEAHFNLANILLDSDRFSEAVDHYQFALKGRPDWTAARQGLAIAQDALREANPADPAASNIDPRSMIDPDIHHRILTELHRTAAEADVIGKKLGVEVVQELDAAFKDLAQCFLKPDMSAQDLSHHLEGFEAAVKDLHAVREQIVAYRDKIAQIGSGLKPT
jgi:tetratricopeptide (TPR) repeat protein